MGKQAANKGLAAANSASNKRFVASLTAVGVGLAKAQKKSDARFGKLYQDMAEDRKSWDKKYEASIKELNEAIAQQAALENEQFTKKLPKKIASYKTAAQKRVDLARKTMKTNIVALTATIKEQETRLNGEIAVVSGQVLDDKAAQARANRKVN